jgi:hypothetical protein
MKKLTIGSFKREGEPGSFQHYFSFKETDETGSIEICLEACMAGYCVAIYDGKGSLLVDFPKVCTEIEGMMEAQIMPGFSLGSGEALEKAVKIANEIYQRYHSLNPVK